MAAEDSLLLIRYNCSKWQVLKGIINLREATIRVINVLAKSLRALVSKSKILVDVPVLVIAPEKHDLFGVLKFKSH